MQVPSQLAGSSQNAGSPPRYTENSVGIMCTVLYSTIMYISINIFNSTLSLAINDRRNTDLSFDDDRLTIVIVIN